MLFLQIDNDEHRESTLLVVLEKPNVERMGEGDPVTLNSCSFGGYIRRVKDPEALQLIVCYEPDSAKLHAVASVGGTGDLLRYLMRGYKFDESKGDGTTATPLKLDRSASPRLQA